MTTILTIAVVTIASIAALATLCLGFRAGACWLIRASGAAASHWSGACDDIPFPTNGRARRTAHAGRTTHAGRTAHAGGAR